MAACPNCGRRTLRTKDWVCQWCGYPLLSGNYKPIEKTFKELQEERNSAWKSVRPEPEPEFDFETKPEARTQAHPEYVPPPEPKPVARPELAPQPQPELLSGSSPESEISDEAEMESEPEPAPAEEQPPMITPPPASMAPPREKTTPEPEAAPEPMITPPPEPMAPPRQEIPAESLTVPSLDSIKDGTELTIDQIDALFRADSVGINAALKDKTVIVKGMVNKVFIRDHLDIRYLILTGNRRAVWSVRCGFGKDSSPQMSRLSEGQSVALRGKYDGFSKNIIFKDCTLVG